MALEIIQVCDSCGTTRGVSATTDSHLEQGGWRKIPVDRSLGKEHVRQPMLCPDCQNLVLDGIRMRRDGYLPNWRLSE